MRLIIKNFNFSIANFILYLFILAENLTAVFFLLSFLSVGSFAQTECSDLFAILSAQRAPLNVYANGLGDPSTITGYANGLGEPGSILRLDAKAYKARVNSDTNPIPRNVILVLDSLPMDLDLPAVRGIIVSKELNNLQSHVVAFAEKFEIPLIYMKGAFESPQFKNSGGDLFT